MNFPIWGYILVFFVAFSLISLAIGITALEEKKKTKLRKEKSYYLIPLMGTNFKNPDGVLIQEVIEMMNEGDDVRLQVGDYGGKRSVRVDSYYGTIGFLSRRFAHIALGIIESGTLGEVKIEKIHLSHTRKTKGIIIKIFIDDKITDNL